MKTPLFLITVLTFFTPQRIIAQTIINNNSEVFGSWTLDMSPIIIDGLTIVPKGKELIIEPGVIVKFLASNGKHHGNEFSFGSESVGYLRVLGAIKAQGTKEKPIKFTRKGKSGYWGAIVIENSNSPNYFNYCEIFFANQIWRIYDGTFSINGISFENSKGEIRNSRIENCRSIGVSLRNSEVKVFNTVINKNYIGILLYTTNSTIENCIVANSKYEGILSRYSNSEVLNSIIWGNGLGIDVKNQALIINGQLTNLSQLDPTVMTSVSYSLIQCKKSDIEEKLKLDHNIYSKNPKFVNASSFVLKPNSNCIGKAHDGTNIGLKN